MSVLDFNINLQFAPDLTALKSRKKSDALVISSCAIHSFSDNRIWSYFDDETFNRINRNEHGLGVIDFEIGFTQYMGTAYPKVFVDGFEMRTDNDLLIKPHYGFSKYEGKAKINQRGETVIGIRYFFVSEEEIAKIISCNGLLFECFFSLEKIKNEYALMCQLKKYNGCWKAEFANTYRPSEKMNMTNVKLSLGWK